LYLARLQMCLLAQFQKTKSFKLVNYVRIIANITSAHFNPALETPRIHKLYRSQTGLLVEFIFRIRELERVIEENKKRK